MHEVPGEGAEAASESAVFVDRIVGPAPRRRKLGGLVELTADHSTSTLLCHSVTVASEAESQEVSQFLQQLDPELRVLTNRFHRVFSAPDRIPPPREVKHQIRLKFGANPARRSPFPLGEAKKEAMVRTGGRTGPSQLGHPVRFVMGSPILFVRKKEGTWRMCVDYCDLNAVTIDDSFLLPRLETLLHRAGEASVFTKLDLASGFHQIELETHSRPYTVFCLPEPVNGNTHWQWNVMPFGLKNAPPTFQRAMTRVLEGCEKFCTVYIDDILVFSTSRQDYLIHLAIVLQRLEEGAFHVRLTKCEFLAEEVEYLGHKLSHGGLSTAPHKVEALSAWQPPLRSAR